MNIIYPKPIYLFIALLLLFFYRERSWNRHSNLLQNRIDDLETLVNSHNNNNIQQIKQSIDATNDGSCNIADEDRINKANIAVNSNRSNSIISNIKDKHIKHNTKYILYDKSGICIFFFIISLKLYEIYYLHTSINTTAPATSTNPSSNLTYETKLRYHSFILLWYPLITTYIYVIILYLAILAWFGYINRTHFINQSYKFIINYLITTPIINILINLKRFNRYLPSTLQQWYNSMKSISWWMWLVSRILGIYNLQQCILYITRIVVILLLIWPYRYYFYYRDSCIIDNSGSSHTYTTNNNSYSNNINENISLQIFLINMIIHISYLYAWLAAIHIYTLGIQLPTLPTISTTIKNLPFYNKISRVLSPILVVLNPFLYANSNNMMKFSILLSQFIMFILCIIRILYNSIYNYCTWYGILISLLYILVYIYVGSSNIGVISTYIYIEEFHKVYKNMFVTSFIKQIKSMNSNNTTNNTTTYNNNTNNNNIMYTEKEEQQLLYFTNQIYTIIINITIQYYILDIGYITYYTIDTRTEEHKNEQKYYNTHIIKKKGHNSDPSASEKEVEIDEHILDIKLCFNMILLLFTQYTTHTDNNNNNNTAKSNNTNSSNSTSSIGVFESLANEYIARRHLARRAAEYTSNKSKSKRVHKGKYLNYIMCMYLYSYSNIIMCVMLYMYSYDSTCSCLSHCARRRIHSSCP